MTWLFGSHGRTDTSPSLLVPFHVCYHVGSCLIFVSHVSDDVLWMSSMLLFYIPCCSFVVPFLPVPSCFSMLCVLCCSLFYVLSRSVPCPSLLNLFPFLPVPLCCFMLFFAIRPLSYCYVLFHFSRSYMFSSSMLCFVFCCSVPCSSFLSHFFPCLYFSVSCCPIFCVINVPVVPFFPLPAVPRCVFCVVPCLPCSVSHGFLLFHIVPCSVFHVPCCSVLCYRVLCREASLCFRWSVWRESRMKKNTTNCSRLLSPERKPSPFSLSQSGSSILLCFYSPTRIGRFKCLWHQVPSWCHGNRMMS